MLSTVHFTVDFTFRRPEEVALNLSHAAVANTATAGIYRFGATEQVGKSGLPMGAPDLPV